MQKNTFLQNPSKVEFVKTPIVEQKTCQSIINNVNKLVRDQAEGRLFAVVHLCGKQYKVTAGDIVVIEGYLATNHRGQNSIGKGETTQYFQSIHQT